ncbi:chemotaxis protein [Massilia sp. Root133]|uniref:HAMP domain-containing protein n=1 Tax=Massilia cellulosiltytica TaxID=2683234 RepID=A0A7X3K791_9BURK|nr:MULTISPECIES: methyl-accepting chemotaxis protein [Telluria group]KQY11704.1 chemotaxis protein [Massilia sp. Root133]KQZ46427.1 chemotaxis protein [Massilia sp. Root1485]MVW60227.1 HAMP domain-containing protein [Telluria cellulosilytica]
MFHNLSIRNKLVAGFGAIVAIILCLLILAYNNFARLSDANLWNRHTLEVLRELDTIATSVLQIQSSTRGYLLTGNENLVTPIRNEYATARAHVKRAQAITTDNAQQQDRLRRLDTLLVTWMEQVVTPQIERRRTAGAAMTAQAEAGVLAGTGSVASLREVLDDVEAEENRLLVQRQKDTDELRQTMKTLLTGGAVICVALAILISTLLVRAVSRPLHSLMSAAGQIAGGVHGARAEVLSRDELGQVALEFNRMAQAIEDSQAKELAATNELRAKVDMLLDVVSRAARGDLTGTVTIAGSDAIGRLGEGLGTMLGSLRTLVSNVQRAGIQVTTSATQIAASARQQEATGIEQAQTSVEVLSTTREISANTSQLLRTMEEAGEVADYTTAATAEAQGNLTRMDQSMQQMVAATDAITAKLATLSEKASNINSVLTTITKVADQTNILSLNAAIEAEKAGEAGRGFAVVAAEIRRLADQTSVSTWDIEQMLKEMQSAVSASVMGMDKFTEDIRRSVGEARHVAEQLSGMTEQVRKLAPRFDLVLQGMQSQAVGASQITATMTQLSDASQQTVDSLKATSEAVHQLQYAATDLQQSVATFSVNTA